MKSLMGAKIGVKEQSTHKNISDARVKRLLEKKRLKKKRKHVNTSK